MRFFTSCEQKLEIQNKPVFLPFTVFLVFGKVYIPFCSVLSFPYYHSLVAGRKKIKFFQIIFGDAHKIHQ